VESRPPVHNGQEATITDTHNEIVSKPVKKKAAIKTENGLAPEAVFVAKITGKSGNGGKLGKAANIKKWLREIIQNDNKETDHGKCIHCPPQGHSTVNCLSKQYCNSPKAANTAAIASSRLPRLSPS